MIAQQRLSPRDLWHFLDWFRNEQWEPGLHGNPELMRSPQFRRLGLHLGLLPEPHRGNALRLLGRLVTGEMPAHEVFVRVGTTISDWNQELLGHKEDM